MGLDRNFLLDETAWESAWRQWRTAELLHCLYRLAPEPLDEEIVVELHRPRFLVDARLIRLQIPDEAGRIRLRFGLEHDRAVIPLRLSRSLEDLLGDGIEIRIDRDSLEDYLCFHACFVQPDGNPPTVLVGSEDFRHLLDLGTNKPSWMDARHRISAPIPETDESEHWLRSLPALVDRELTLVHYLVERDGQVRTLAREPDRCLLTLPEQVRALCAAASPHQRTVAAADAGYQGDWPEGDLAKPPIPLVEGTATAERRTGVRVVQTIAPAESTDLETALAPYQALLESPCPLAPVPDLEWLSMQLRDAFPWLERVTRAILQELAVAAQGRGGFRLPPLLLLGDAGIGKTAYARFLAEIGGVHSRLLSLAGKTDNRDLIGTARGWGNRHPGLGIRLIAESGQANPLIVLDEIDKAGGSRDNGNVHDALLTLLEPQSARAIHDDFLCGSVDLSHLSYIATANRVDLLPGALLDRFRVFRVDPPEPEHYPAIVHRTIQAYVERHQLDPRLLPPLDEVDWRWLGQFFRSPRQARKATETLIGHRLTHPRPGMRLN
ncbi:AAA ATPase central domain protein [Thiorhodococcus drewsii AZ1]|uniref:AAA ATPase central domain protein n=1 Tax=Thiorhodococcus drewsii AZ1 TaxID=765913 RepID=G2E896_9GAMM|nr:AAA family ATPase [Thiorhodococcus drewsii]EGV27676.1 AAA ATPase central domain protein [Thiorhodococcus drewsii AZ1]